jgi:hypothetical protein
VEINTTEHDCAFFRIWIWAEISKIKRSVLRNEKGSFFLCVCFHCFYFSFSGYDLQL